MLFTRCPECTTTFRVSDEALKKANGQVRCGRCANVFNALVEQVGRRATEAPPVATAPQAVATPPPEPAPAVPEPPSASAADVASQPLPSPGPPPQPSAVEAQPHSAVGEETPRPHAPPPEPPPTVPRDAGAASIGAVPGIPTNLAATAGDGQVSVGNTVMKHTARKVRRLAGGGTAPLAFFGEGGFIERGLLP